MMANDLLNTSSSAIWLGNEQGELQLASSNGTSQNLEKVPDTAGDPNSLLMPLVTGEDARAVGMFGVFNTEAGEGRSVQSEWDKKVLACLANYAVLAVQNESHQRALRASEEQHWTAETFAAVGDISANLLHNMNNKVGTIPVRIQSIQDKYRELLENDSYLSNNLAEIERSAGEAMQVAQENLSHLRPIRMGKVQIASRVAEALRTVQVPPEVQIEINGLDELPTVIAGGQSLSFVFINLIENAIAAMHGKGLIVIQGATANDWVEVTVSDSGPGISPELHNQIFELNYSGRAHPGKLGFGLWWVKTLMTRLGGSAVVESDGQHGTTFRLRLPVNAEAQ